MQTLVFLDIETYSPVDLGVHGPRVYAEHAEILMIQMAQDNEPVELYEIDSPDPSWGIAAAVRRIQALLARDPSTVRFVIHNGYAFDLVLLERCLGLKIPVDQVVDTMNRARLHGYPKANLAALCAYHKIPETLSKKQGGQLVKLFCCGPVRVHTRDTDPSAWQEFRAYAEHDIIALREVYKRLPRTNVTSWERKVELASQRMNARGLPLDRVSAERIHKRIGELNNNIHSELGRLSGGAITSPGQRARLLEYLKARGVDLPDTQGVTLQAFLDGPEHECTELVEAFAEGQTTSTAKYTSLLDRSVMDATGTYRLYDSLNYRGAVQTGRWSATGFQPQNLPSRRTLDPEEITRLLVSGEEPRNYWAFAKSALRQMIQAPSGTKILIVDYSGIESRIQAAIAGDAAKLQRFRDFDEGKGPDSYVFAYSQAFGIPVDQVTPFQRSIGKVMELALGYQGGPGAFLRMAMDYRIDLAELVSTVRLPWTITDKARSSWYYEQNRSTPYEVFEACYGLVQLWRQRHPKIVGMWNALQSDLDAVDTGIGRFDLPLPSGRTLFYYNLKRDPEGAWIYSAPVESSTSIIEKHLYGGKLFQNICQATSADILGDAMVRLQEHRDHDRTSAELIFTVHDELVLLMSESEDPRTLVLPEIMKPPSFLPDIPLNISWKSCNRYQK